MRRVVVTEEPPSLRSLYPPVEPFDTGYLDVGDGHRIYYEQSGVPEGKPAFFLHGGPGGGGSRMHARLWNPRRYRIVVFDQRGVGKSTPSACTDAGMQANTTWHLVDDIERLRAHFALPKMQLLGGSWGSTLALAYATRYPDRVASLIVRGVCMFRRRELSWFFQDGASRLFPDAFDVFVAPLSPQERQDHLAAYRRRLWSDDRRIQQDAVRRWRAWEDRLSQLRARTQPMNVIGDGPISDHGLAMSRLECLYSCEGAFFDRDDYLLHHAPALSHLPLEIVQGRYDLVCPMESAWQLHKAWRGSRLNIAYAGHAMFEKHTAHHLVEATDRLADT